MTAEQQRPAGPGAERTEERPSGGRHHAEDGAERHPLIDLDRDPTPGVADHAAPEDE